MQRSQVKVFAIPLPENGKYLTKDWNLRHPLFVCNSEVVTIYEDEENVEITNESGPGTGANTTGQALQSRVVLNLLDNHGDIICECPYDGRKGIFSTERTQNYAAIAQGNGLGVLLGVEFVDRTDALTLAYALQEFRRRMNAATTNWEGRGMLAEKLARGSASGWKMGSSSSHQPFKSRFEDSSDEDEPEPRAQTAINASTGASEIENLEDADTEFGEFQ